MSKIDPDKAELVQKYLHASMNEEETAYLNHLLDADEDFAKDLQIEAAAYAQRSLRLKTLLRKEFGNPTQISSDQTPEKKVKRFLPYWAKVAAILILLLLSFWAIENLRQDANPSAQLADTYFSIKHPEPPTQMDGNAPAIDSWEIAKEAYRKNEYEVAIAQVLALESPTDEQLLYLALSYGYKKEADFDSAIPIFKRILSNPTSQIHDQALWYLSLSLLKMNKKMEAKAYLQTILEEKSWQYSEAEKLLKSLED